MNFLLILGVTTLQIMIASIWFSPRLFGKFWMKVNRAEGLSKHEMKELGKSAVPFYVIQFILQLVTNAIIYIAVNNAGPNGGAFALVIWLGFMMPVVVQNEIWINSENSVKFKKILVVGGQLLITTVLAGIIFGIFR
jgi:Protein of unknown function (DUF1761)